MKTKVIPKKERHELYKKSRELIKSEGESFLCIAFNTLNVRLYWVEIDELEELLPEFKILSESRPRNRKYAFWGDDQYGRRKRLEWLDKVIKETKPKKKNNSKKLLQIEK